LWVNIDRSTGVPLRECAPSRASLNPVEFMNGKAFVRFVKSFGGRGHGDMGTTYVALAAAFVSASVRIVARRVL
jgi:hypothetical protein